MDKVFITKQLRRALELFAQTITDESTMMEIADVYPVWVVGKSYNAGHVVRYGLNADNETQLYSVLQQHVSQDNWKPDATPSIYKAVGFAPSGIPIWTQPLGASDAYQNGDIVQHNDLLWISDVDGNVWEPGVYGWTITQYE